MKLVVVNHLSLDGVMQAPGRADEDTRGGFTHGGWAAAGSDAVVGQALGEHMGRSAGLLFGRRTYEEVLGHWNREYNDVFTPALNHATKYVVSRRLRDPLLWPNSVLVGGDAVDAVRRLKAESGDELLVMGSGNLIQTLLPHDLIDEYVLLIHPIVLGSGLRLFPAGTPPSTLSLVSSISAPSGVLAVTYAAAT